MMMKLFYTFLIFSTIYLQSAEAACNDLPNGQRVKSDSSCAAGGGLGCNAGGQGQNCRFCGFGEFKRIKC
jgi:hypothetical protein